jgi:hypothetical protein
MYSPIMIAKRQRGLEARLGHKLLRHSPSECQAQRAALDSLLDDKGEMRRPLQPSELAWIENERALCKIDFLYYATRYCYINDTSNRLVLFNPTLGQRVMVGVWGELEERHAEIVIQALKARQLGISTLSELAVAHRVQFFEHTRAVVGSSDPDKSALMSRMMELAWSEMPWWLMPSRTKYKSGQLIEFGNQNSVVSIQHGTQFSGIARGTTVTVGHLSELADFDDPANLVDAALVKAIHPSPRVLLILESTAHGRAGWWFDTWELSKKGYEKGFSRFFPVFLPWYVGQDMYPHPTWLASRRQIFAEWQPSDAALAHKAKAEAYVGANELLRRYLGSGWEMSRPQVFWWDMQREEHRAKGILHIFKQECPADDAEAFQSGNISIFDAETMERARERARQPVGVFGISGSTAEIPARVQPPASSLQPGKRPIEITANWARTQAPSRYLLLPLKYDTSRFDPLGKLVVWEMPQPSEDYAIGVDTAEGVGADRSVIQVVRKGTMKRNDEQVAEFASDVIGALDLWPIVMAIGSLYSTAKEDRLRQPLVAIECSGNGEATQLELKKRGWVNFHLWVRYDSKKIDRSKATKLGWYTNTWSRAMMLDNLIKYVRDGWVDLNSLWLMDEEMANFERNEDKNKLMAALGAHDDRIMALGIALFCAHDSETRGASGSVAQTRQEQQAADLVYPTYPGHPGSQPELAFNNHLRSSIEFY